MYEELVKRLRSTQGMSMSKVEFGSCRVSIEVVSKLREDAKDAADAIEELIKRETGVKKVAQLAEQNGQKDSQKEMQIETNTFDIEEIYTNCTVQVWRNSVTGEVSVGWWRNEEEQDDV